MQGRRLELLSRRRSIRSLGRTQAAVRLCSVSGYPGTLLNANRQPGRFGNRKADTISLAFRKAGSWLKTPRNIDSTLLRTPCRKRIGEAERVRTRSAQCGRSEEKDRREHRSAVGHLDAGRRKMGRRHSASRYVRSRLSGVGLRIHYASPQSPRAGATVRAHPPAAPKPTHRPAESGCEPAVGRGSLARFNRSRTRLCRRDARVKAA